MLAQPPSSWRRNLRCDDSRTCVAVPMSGAATNSSRTCASTPPSVSAAMAALDMLEGTWRSEPASRTTSKTSVGNDLAPVPSNIACSCLLMPGEAHRWLTSSGDQSPSGQPNHTAALAAVKALSSAPSGSRASPFCTPAIIMQMRCEESTPPSASMVASSSIFEQAVRSRPRRRSARMGRFQALRVSATPIWK